MFTILDYSSALEYSIIRRYTNIVYYYYNTSLWNLNISTSPSLRLVKLLNIKSTHLHIKRVKEKVRDLYS